MKLRAGVFLAMAWASFSFAGVARAAYVDFLELDGVTGESHPPGFPDATQIYSLTVGKNTFSETQPADSTLPHLLITSSFTDAAIAFYKVPINGTQPYEKILFHDLALSSYQATSFGQQQAERITFQFLSPADYLYLGLPGVGSVPIDELTITGNAFSIHKPVDTSSPTLAAAFANGQLFPTSTLLLYTAVGSAPDVSIVFDHALISSIVSDANGDGETVSFTATDSTVPEPQAIVLLALGILASVTSARSKPR